MQPIAIDYDMHFKDIPNKNSLVILRSTGKLTNILPNAVIFG